MKILMVLTSHEKLGNTGRKTGSWLEEFAAPYFIGRCGLPCARCAPSCQVPGPTNRERQAGDGLHQWRGGGSPPYQDVPFLVEDELKLLGGLYEKAADWASFVVIDERLVTGQNPASSKAGA
jgi:hypothetical protein